MFNRTCFALFRNLYNDITFNPSKSIILRLGPHKKPAISLCGIPTSEQHTYLGIEIGRAGKQDKTVVAKLYRNANIMLHENKSLRKCNVNVKNVAINSNGSIYVIENMTEISPTIRQAHCYLT